MQEINLWECDDLELFFHILSNDVIAYNEREKLNDLEKKKSSIPTDPCSVCILTHLPSARISTTVARVCALLRSI